jgi:hypoxanthine phosphoribosyltransferase
MKKLALLGVTLTSLCFAAGDLNVLITSEEISQKVKQVAAQIDQDYAGEEVTIVMIMKGAICITADLMRHLQTPTTLEYIKASSYGGNGSVRGELTVLGLERLCLDSKHVLVIDDILDSGITMDTVVRKLKEKNPKSIKTLVLLSKNVPHAVPTRPDYVLFDIDDHFVVGYGLDYKELYRGLPGIHYFKQ